MENMIKGKLKYSVLYIILAGYKIMQKKITG